ncbi:lipocalin-like domain-containing protein [Flavobacterium hercynium]|uniref:Lipocalin-like domain-containing protein n=1 Tax=Flavobacterium hercynium TaxID=387094 RepID=A0A226HQ26_9FLAO|nr:lipocalin family protein [Flavobacterium hercynium]OXA96305.1 hypothetical protein B0A66_01660 [Flavobacterium hercynium]SMP04212.1 Lipocalin-like domain-containing protein [Flavobacterium hercynium]
MKKLSILFVSVLTLGLAVTSCSSDDDDASIVGKWTPVKMGSVVNGKEILVDYPKEGTCDSDVTEFTADGKFTDISYESNEGKCEASTDKGSYTYKDKTLSTTYEGDTEVNSVEVTELSGSTLKIKLTEKIDASTSLVLITVYQRK